MSKFKVSAGTLVYVSPEAVVNNELDIPEEVDGETIFALGDNLLANRTDIELVILPKTVTKIGLRAFYNCSALKDIYLSTNVNEIQSSAFAYSGIEYISLYGTRLGMYIFEGCQNLKKVVLNGQKIITTGMFLDSSLEEINLESVHKIEAYAFKNTNIHHLTLKSGSKLSYIGNSAFLGCAVTDILLPDTLLYIGAEAFRDCIKMTSCKITSHSHFIELEDNIFMGCKKIGSINWPFNYVPDGTFCDCQKLSQINFEKKITKIGRFAFYNTGFISFVWPEDVEVNEGVLANCSKLAELNIHEKDLHSIPFNEAFYNSKKLKKSEIYSCTA